MPKGPAGRKRPADVVSNAVHVMRVLTGEADNGSPVPGRARLRRNSAARAVKRGLRT